MYEKRVEWYGFYQLWIDWKGDRWMLPSICRWYDGELPKWLTIEDEIGELDESPIMEY